eukprot:COSAG05_NODE_536_length_8861_cov_4.614700_6_plen_38_part_00
MKMEDIDPAMLADPTVTMMNFLAVVDRYDACGINRPF